MAKQLYFFTSSTSGVCSAVQGMNCKTKKEVKEPIQKECTKKLQQTLFNASKTHLNTMHQLTVLKSHGYEQDWFTKKSALLQETERLHFFMLWPFPITKTKGIIYNFALLKLIILLMGSLMG